MEDLISRKTLLKVLKNAGAPVDSSTLFRWSQAGLFIEPIKKGRELYYSYPEATILWGRFLKYLFENTEPEERNYVWLKSMLGKYPFADKKTAQDTAREIMEKVEHLEQGPFSPSFEKLLVAGFSGGTPEIDVDKLTLVEQKCSKMIDDLSECKKILFIIGLWLGTNNRKLNFDKDGNLVK